MPVKRHYLKIGHSDIRILPIVIDVEDEQWFAEEYSEFMKLININSKMLLNFQTKRSISDSFGEKSEESSKRPATKIIGKNFSFSYSLKENVENNNNNNNSNTAVGKVCQFKEMCDVYSLLNFTLYCTVYNNTKYVPSNDKASCSEILEVVADE
jgi:hypothetical protein